MTLRLFRRTVSQMLLACLNIAENGIENAELLSTKRSQWANPYFPNLKIKITEAEEKGALALQETEKARLATDEAIGAA